MRDVVSQWLKIDGVNIADGTSENRYYEETEGRTQVHLDSLRDRELLDKRCGRMSS